MIRKIFLSMIMLVMLTGAALAATFPSAPTHDIYVADYAAMISDADKNQMLELGRELDQKIAVVTLDTLDGADIDEYANGLFRAWGIGDRKKNNGVLLLIAKEDHKFRIEVGYGLEGAITDGYAGSILDSMKEQFRAENYSSAILNAYARLTLKVYDEYGETPSENLNKLAETEEPTLGDKLFEGGIILTLLATIIGGIYALIKKIYSSMSPDSHNNNPSTASDNDDDNSSSDSNDSFGGGSSGGGGASDGW